LLVPKLAAAGQQVRALVQSEASAAAARALGAAEAVVGDMADPAVLARAMAGVRAVYHVGPTVHPLEREMGFRMVDAARDAGVGHVVFSSVLHAILTDLVQHEIKRDIEEYLISSGLEFTILQPSNYMLPLKLKPAFAEGVFRLSWSLARRQTMVDLGDVTEVAAKVLIEGAPHWGATYELAGEGRYTGHDLAAIIAAVTGRPIRAEEIDGDTYLKAWFGEVSPDEFPHQARVLRSISARYSSHDFIGNPNVLTWLLGRAPTSFEAFVRAQYESWQA
jgi:uncharacterized protein YbjT (DUF2867 family)